MPDCSPSVKAASGRAGTCHKSRTFHSIGVPALPPRGLPIADVNALLPHGVQKHSDAVQGLRDVWHGHGGARSPEAEEQLPDVIHAAGEEDNGCYQSPHIDALEGGGPGEGEKTQNTGYN